MKCQKKTNLKRFIVSIFFETIFFQEFIVDFEYKDKTWTLKKSFKTVKCFAKELSKTYSYLTTKPFFIGLMGKMKPELKGNRNKPEYFDFKKMQITRFFTVYMNILPFDNIIFIGNFKNK